MTPTTGLQRQAKNGRPDWYAVLGVEPSATFAEIRAAYRRQALTLHADRLRSTRSPDALAMAHDRLKTLGDAYRTLRSPDTRRAYDRARLDRSVSPQEAAPKGTPASPRRAARSTRPRQPAGSGRRLGRIAVVVGFALLVLWAVLTTIAERREVAASVRSNSPAAAAAPVPWPPLVG